MTISIHIDRHSTSSARQFQGIDRWSLGRRAVFVLAALLILVMALPGFLRLGGFQVIAVNGHSMGQAVPDQSIVITRIVPGESLRTGDVVVIGANWLDGGAEATKIVHRLNLVVATPDGLLGYTSGDANVIADPLPVSLHGEVPLVSAVMPSAGIFYGISSTTIFAIATMLLLLVSDRSMLTDGDST